MFLVDIVKQIKSQVKILSDIGRYNKIPITYDLIGRIVIESKGTLVTKYVSLGQKGTRAIDETNNLGEVYFKGRLIYLVENGSGKMNLSPIKNPKFRKDFIIAMINEIIEELPYEFSHDEKNDEITINSNRNLEEELKRIEEVFGNPTRQEFKI